MVRGPSYSLRLLDQDDVPALFELGKHPDVSRFFSWGPYKEEHEAADFVGSLDRQRQEGERLELGIIDSQGRLLGVTGLSEGSRRDRRAIIGTWLGRQYWGSGANRESKALLLSLAFRHLGLLRITALASPQNVRSVAALERLGFVHEGVLRSWHVHGGVPRDVACLRILRDEWERTPLADVPVEVEGDIPPAFVVFPD